MRKYSLTHLSDTVLLQDLTRVAIRDRETTADLLACIAEVDARELYASAGHSSMHAYCVKVLRLSEGAAFKRIRAARAAREFPELYPALAEGRLHLAAIYLLAPHLTPANVGELMTAATDRTKSEIEAYLAKRFPTDTLQTSKQTLRVMPSAHRQTPLIATGELLPPGAVDRPARIDSTEGESVHGPSMEPTREGENAARKGHPLPPGAVEPTPAAVVSERFLLRLVLDKETHDKLRYAQELLGHAVPSGDLVKVLGRALDSLIPQLEQRKFGARSSLSRKGKSAPPATGSPATPSTTKARYIPATVRRAVWKRDGGQCTFVGTDGHRCRSRKRLEYDHVTPLARGGASTVDGLRLRCRAHNQLEAENAFGVEFMKRKREEARRSARLGASAP